MCETQLWTVFQLIFLHCKFKTVFLQSVFNINYVQTQLWIVFQLVFLQCVFKTVFSAVCIQYRSNICANSALDRIQKKILLCVFNIIYVQTQLWTAFRLVFLQCVFKRVFLQCIFNIIYVQTQLWTVFKSFFLQCVFNICANSALMYSWPCDNINMQILFELICTTYNALERQRRGCRIAVAMCSPGIQHNVSILADPAYKITSGVPAYNAIFWLSSRHTSTKIPNCLASKTLRFGKLRIHCSLFDIPWMCGTNRGAKRIKHAEKLTYLGSALDTIIFLAPKKVIYSLNHRNLAIDQGASVWRVKIKHISKGEFVFNRHHLSVLLMSVIL